MAIVMTKMITSKTKPLPCCARCKKRITPGCQDFPASFLCNDFDNDGTAESIKIVDNKLVRL